MRLITRHFKGIFQSGVFYAETSSYLVSNEPPTPMYGKNYWSKGFFAYSVPIEMEKQDL
jgi:hypothetical protein